MIHLFERFETTWFRQMWQVLVYRQPRRWGSLVVCHMVCVQHRSLSEAWVKSCQIQSPGASGHIGIVLRHVKTSLWPSCKRLWHPWFALIWCRFFERSSLKKHGVRHPFHDFRQVDGFKFYHDWYCMTGWTVKQCETAGTSPIWEFGCS